MGQVCIKVDAIIQARRGSSRLPDKVVKKIAGKPMLAHVIERVRRAKCISNVYVATSNSHIDKALSKIAQSSGAETFFGSDSDVLDRYYKAAKEFNIRNIARITADCPLIDPSIIDKVATLFSSGNFDYVSNTHPPSFPDGLDVEIFTFDALEMAWEGARKISDREHVTPYIWNNPASFKMGNLANETDLSSMRWTVDNAEDLLFVRRVYNCLYRRNPNFVFKDVLSLLEKRPELQLINSKYERNSGYKKSIREDDII